MNPPPSDQTASSLLESFSRQWDRGPAPDIAAFLNEAPAEARRELLIDLVLIDLQRRWQLAAAETKISGDTATLPGIDRAAAARPLLEDYVGRFAELESAADLPLEAIKREFVIRRQCGDAPRCEQYLERFPDRADSLRPVLDHLDDPQQVDATIEGSYLAASSPRPSMLQREFGEYELLEEIARGGMGVVYKARQIKAKRVVALKMILAGQLAGEQEVQRFYAEAEASAKLDHPHIVPVFDVGQVQQQHYFSMGFVDGSSLKDLLKQGPITPERSARLLRDIAEAIAYAHGKGVIHRDLKPANVLLDRAGHVRVTDFGLAKQLGGDSNLTITGQIMGTPSYMPPEQALGENVGTAADIYSLGAVLYEMLTGRKPFAADSSLEILKQVLESEPPPPRTLIASIPRDLETICLKCMRKDQGNRYRTAAELMDDLDFYLTDRPITARPVTNVERMLRWCRRNPTSALLSGGLLTLIVAISIVSSIAYFRQARLSGALSQALKAKTSALGQAEAARKTAEELKSVAVKESTVAKQARRQEQLQRRQGQVLLATNLFERGIETCERGDIDKGLHWMIRALSTLPDGEVDLERVIRLNIASWSPLLHRLRARAHVPAKYVALTSDGSHFIAFQPRLSRSLIFEVADATPARVQPPLPVPQLDEVLLSSKDVLAMRQGPHVMFWRVAAPSEILSVRLPNTPSDMAFTRNGEFLASAGGQTLTLHRIRTGELVDEYSLEGSIRTVIASLDDSAVAAITNDSRVWLCQKGTKQPHQLEESANTADFSPDGSRIAIGASSYGNVQVLDVASKQVLAELKHPVWNNEAEGLSYGPAGLRVVATRNGLADIWDAQTYQHLGNSMQHDNWLAAAAFSSRGDVLATWGRRETRIWHAATAQQAGQTLRHKALTGAIRHLEGPLVTSDGDQVGVWQTRADPDRWVATRPLIQSGFWMVAYPNDRPIAISYVHRFQLIDLDSRQPMPDVDPDLEAHSCTLSADGTHVGLVRYPVYGEDGPGGTQVVELLTGKRVGMDLSGVTQVSAVHPQGQYLLGTRAGRVALWNTATAEMELIEDATSPLALGKKFGFCGVNNDPAIQGRFFDLDTKQVRAELRRDGAPLEHAALSTDEQLLAVVDTEGVVTVWETESGRQVGKPISTTGCKTLDVCPSRQLVAASNSHGVVQIWDFATGHQVGPPVPNHGAARGLSFSQRGEDLLTGGVRWFRRRRISVVPASPPNVLALELQVATGAESDDLGAIRTLEIDEWRRRQQQLLTLSKLSR